MCISPLSGYYVKDNALASCALHRDEIPDKEHLQIKLDKWIEEVADKRSFKLPDGETRTVESLYEEERPLLSFPPQLATTFDITTWTTIADKDAVIYLYGFSINLAPNYANKLVHVSMRANGETLVMARDGEILAQVLVPMKNLLEHSRKDKPKPGDLPAKQQKEDSQHGNLLQGYSAIMS